MSAASPRILLLQGPNLEALGEREPEFYGTTTRAQLDAMLRAHARARAYRLSIRYEAQEARAISLVRDAVRAGYDGLVMNPAGFLYSGHALRDCLHALPWPFVEVHISNLERRGIRSLFLPLAHGVVFGFGMDSYIIGLDAMLGLLGVPVASA